MTTIMKMNCILTFDKPDADGDNQDFFNIEMQVSEQDRCWRELLNAKLFGEISAFCESVGRDPRQLSKISTCADWDAFEQCTGESGLVDHNGKWFFGHGRDDLDAWENALMGTYGFGEDVDSSWMQEVDPTKAFIERVLKNLGSAA